MSYAVVVHAPESAKEVVERLTHENLENKLDSYLKSFRDGRVQIDVKVSIHEGNTYSGILRGETPEGAFHFDRERYVHLDDLINHLFDKLKESLSHK